MQPSIEKPYVLKLPTKRTKISKLGIRKRIITIHADLLSILHRYIDDCGYSRPTTCQVVSRMFGRQFTMEELRAAYQQK